MIKDFSLWELVKRTVRPLHLPGVPYRRTSPPGTTDFKLPLDLHGLTVQEAYNEVMDGITESHMLGAVKMVIITGKSGQIAREFPHWVSRAPCVRSCTPINGGGAYELVFKKKGA